MRIRFAQTLPSANPDFPVQVGQVINVPHLTPEMRGWLETGGAVLLDPPEAEAAVLGAPAEMATVSRPRAKGARA